MNAKDHLAAVVENHKHGTKKAAEMRKKKKKTSESVSNVSHTGYHCHLLLSTMGTRVLNYVHIVETCGEEFGESDDSNELWIGCDLCDKWYHCSCEGLYRPPLEELYACNMCQR